MDEKNYVDLGELEIDNCDDLNIPVNCFLTENYDPDPEEEDFDPEELKYEGWFQWTADNFMPEKDAVETNVYRIMAKDKKTILGLVEKYVIPLYEAALDNLKASGGNYYWKRE